MSSSPAPIAETWTENVLPQWQQKIGLQKMLARPVRMLPHAASRRVLNPAAANILTRVRVLHHVAASTLTRV